MVGGQGWTLTSQVVPARPQHSIIIRKKEFIEKVMSTPVSYKTRWTKGDGNCMFRAFARALGGLSHQEVRAGGVRWMRTHPEDFVHSMVDRGGGQEHALEEYLEKMSRDREWGDHHILQAMCVCYRAHVFVLKEGGQEGGQMWTEVGDRDISECTFWLYLKDSHYENLVDIRQIQRP